MPEKAEVVAFFDRLAASWDAGMVRNEAVIRTILDNADVKAEKRVLDVACGTGVLIPDYLARGVKSVTAIDLSPEMAKIAARKFAQDPRVAVLCMDAETATFEKPFDCIVVYNAFPHFCDPKQLLHTLAGLLAPNGVLTVAHGMSRERLMQHHSGSAQRVSSGLMPAEELANLFAAELTVTTVISDENMYQVVGKKA